MSPFLPEEESGVSVCLCVVGGSGKGEKMNNQVTLLKNDNP